MFGIERFGNEAAVYLVFLVIAVIIIFYHSYYWKKSKMKEFAHVNSIKIIFDQVSMTKRLIKYSLICVAYLFLIFALMRPQGKPDQNLDDSKEEEKNISAKSLELKKDNDEEGEKIKLRESARDIIFLLDVSGSMSAEDLSPNRLDKAKDIISDIVDSLDGEHVGLVIFTSIPSVKCILTLDYTYFKTVLKDVEINDNDYAGTKFMPAFEEIIHKQFDFSENKYKELIVITDGGDTDIESSTNQEEKKALEQELINLCARGNSENQIRIHTIGIGSKNGSILPGIKDAKGNFVKSSLNENLLKEISKAAKGVYIGLADGDVDMKEKYKKYIGTEDKGGLEREVEVSKKNFNQFMQKQKEEAERKIVYQEIYWIPLFICILLLTIEFFLDEKKGKRNKNVST